MNIRQDRFTDKAKHNGRACYRFYSIDLGHRIVLAEDHECEEDNAALALGKKLLLASQYPKIEVWYGKLRVSVLAKDSASF